jgi:outer membrane murein-binding lipoprotein Lpp
MTMTSSKRYWHRIVVLLVSLAAATFVLGGCSTMFPSQRKAQPGPSVQPLSDEQARAQVVDSARELVKAAKLTVNRATFAWEWCNDQGDPPYHGRVDVAFAVPQGVDGSAFSKQVAATAAQQPGWAPGPPPGMHPFGDVVHKGGVMVIIGPGHYPEVGALELSGECRNMNDHRKDTDFRDITDELRS